jgi:PleD family two-component response regulator
MRKTLYRLQKNKKVFFGGLTKYLFVSNLRHLAFPSGFDNQRFMNDNTFAAEETAANLPKKRILLAEDDAAMRKLLEIVLARAGYDVLPVEDGLTAMQAADEEEFDAAVIDAIMPNLSGYELCRIFRAHPVWQDLPLILMSGLEAEPGAEADVHIIKTAQLQEELLANLASLLSARG